MRNISEIQSIPKIKLMLPSKESGIARFKLKSSKHTQLVRVVFSWHSGFDVVQAMFKQGKRPTSEEIAEIKQRFFQDDEIAGCEEILHPDNDLIVVIFRQQEVANEKQI